MHLACTLLGGMGLGAGLMYLFDPDMGRRRRALVRDKAISASHQLEDSADVTWRDIRQRTQGLVAETSGRWTHEQASDRVLAERVRSKLGRCVSHPRAIDVYVRGGRATLSGPILESEVNAVLSCVSSVPGVSGVENLLTVHKQAGNIPDLQGGRCRAGERLNLFEKNWAPATRLLAGVAGGTLLAFGLTQRFPIACVLGTVGLGLLARAGTNQQLGDLLALDVRDGNGVSGRPTLQAQS